MPFTAKVITTAEWGARPAQTTFEKTFPRYVIVHHTDNHNPPEDFSKGSIEGAIRLARNIQRGHMDDPPTGNGWSDSGHNFLNTTGGFVLEGRHGSLDAVKQGFCIQSAHAAQDIGKLANGNQSPGIENEGTFMTFQMIPKQWNSLVELCASLCDSCNVSPRNIRGHRDFSDTDCPGDWLYSQLPHLRKEVAIKLGIQISEDKLENDSILVDLMIGSTGGGVIKLQQRLSELSKQLGKDKFNPGAIDGVFGEQTDVAVKSFQNSVKLQSDGIVGPVTRNELGLS
jgi:hypothetical protein